MALPISVIESTIWSNSSKLEEPSGWSESPKLEEPSTNRRSSRLLNINGHPIRQIGPLPSKVMDLVEVNAAPKIVPNAAPKIVPAPSHTKPSVGPRQSNRLKGQSPVANYCDEV